MKSHKTTCKVFHGSPTVRVICEFCPRIEREEDLLVPGRAHWNPVECKIHIQRWDGPCGVMKQEFAVGTCDRCGNKHVVPLGMFMDEHDEVLLDLRDVRGETLAMLEAYKL